jgi:hypothetical protein
MAWMPFERKLEGLICSDPKISLFVRLKTLLASGIFWILFFAVEKEYLVRRDSRQNHQGGWREACFIFTKYQIIGIDFMLVNHTSMMIRTQSRRSCRDVQLGEAALLKNPVSPQE